MRIASARNTISGIFWGVVNKVITLIMPFILRTVLIYKIGADYAGLSSIFTSILRILNMAELGLTSAAAYSFYKPVAEDDAEKVCALMSFYRKIYYTMGTVILFIGLLLIPFLEYLINGPYPEDINLRVLYLIYLFDSAASYFLFSYKNIILNVYQRVDIISIISSILHLVVYAIQILILVCFRAYYIYVLFDLVYTVLNNCLIAKYVSQKYPQYKCKGTLNKYEKKKILKSAYGMFLFKVYSATRNSFDTVFVSSFVGLTAASIYGNYYYVFSGVASIQTIIRESLQGGIGNKIAINTPEKNHDEMLVYMFMYAWLSGACTACMLCLFQPFMKIWVGEDLMLDEPTMIAFCVYFYVLSMGSIRFVYHQAAGLFWEKRYWTIAAAAMNVFGNFFLVQIWGTFGVVCSTIFSLLIVDFGYSTTIVYDYYFKNNKKSIFYKKQSVYLIVTALGCIPAYLTCKKIYLDGVLGIAAKLLTSLLISNLIFYTIYRTLPEYQKSVEIAKNIRRIICEKIK